MMYSRRRIPAMPALCFPLSPLPLTEKVEELGILGTDRVAKGGSHRSAPNFVISTFLFEAREMPFFCGIFQHDTR